MQTINDNRITARVPSAVKATLEQAAVLRGATVNQFMLTASLQAAEEVIRQEQAVNLSRHDVRAMFDYLESDPQPNIALRSAAQKHRAMTEG